MMAKLRILYVIPSYEPAWAFGGTVTATSQLCKALARKGVDITVYTTAADGKGGHTNVRLNELIELDGVKVWYFHCDFGITRAFYSKALSKRLKDAARDFDLIHVSSLWQWHQVDVSKVCSRDGIPYVVTPHNSLSSSSMNLDRNVKKNIYWWLCGRQTIKKASAIHFLCEGERRTSMSNIYNVPSFVIPNGIEISRNNTKIKSPCLRAKLGIKEQSLVLLYVGRIHPVKRVELIIESLSYLNSSDIFLIVVGPVLDNNYLDSLKRLSIHCNVDNKLKWIGPISNNAMAEFYEMADLLVLLSEYEGISMTSIEAMNKGTPLLVSEGVLNWKEIVADGAGIVMKNIGPKDISNQLNMLNLDRSYLKKLSQNAIKSAMYRYDIDNVSHLMIKAYMDILTAQRSPELQWNQ